MATKLTALPGKARAKLPMSGRVRSSYTTGGFTGFVVGSAVALVGCAVSLAAAGAIAIGFWQLGGWIGGQWHTDPQKPAQHQNAELIGEIATEFLIGAGVASTVAFTGCALSFMAGAAIGSELA